MPERGRAQFLSHVQQRTRLVSAASQAYGNAAGLGFWPGLDHPIRDDGSFRLAGLAGVRTGCPSCAFDFFRSAGVECSLAGNLFWLADARDRIPADRHPLVRDRLYNLCVLFSRPFVCATADSLPAVGYLCCLFELGYMETESRAVTLSARLGGQRSMRSCRNLSR